MSFLQQQNEFIQLKSEFIFGKYILRLTLCELHQPFVAMYQCFTLCAHLFFRSPIQLNCLIWLVLLFQGFSVFCTTFLAFLFFLRFFMLCDQEPLPPLKRTQPIRFVRSFLWFSVLCISYIFASGDVDVWMWMSGCSPLTTSHRRSSIRTIHEARPYCTASASSLGQSRPSDVASQAESWGHDKVQVGTFWDVPNVLLRASGAQLGLDIVAQ